MNREVFDKILSETGSSGETCVLDRAQALFKSIQGCKEMFSSAPLMWGEIKNKVLSNSQ